MWFTSYVSNQQETPFKFDAVKTYDSLGHSVYRLSGDSLAGGKPVEVHGTWEQVFEWLERNVGLGWWRVYVTFSGPGWTSRSTQNTYELVERTDRNGRKYATGELAL